MKDRTPIDEKFDTIRYCIENNYEEDFEEHVFDLLRSLRVKDKADSELTSLGLELKSLWSICWRQQ